jgi:hypothetical protein
LLSTATFEMFSNTASLFTISLDIVGILNTD